MTGLAWAFTALTLLGLVGQLAVRFFGGRKSIEGGLKLFASSCFLATALALGAARSGFGQVMLVGLVASWVGDAFLIGKAKRWVAGGLLAFLLAHVAYIVALLPLVSLGKVPPLGVTLVLAGVVVAGVHTIAESRLGLGKLLIPAAIYTTILSIMAIVAVCAWLSEHGERHRWLIGAGGLLFLVSDIAVARQRFVRPSFRTRLWGLPAYYLAQLALAAAAGLLVP